MCHDSPTCDGELGKGYLTHTGTREILARFLFTALTRRSLLLSGTGGIFVLQIGRFLSPCHRGDFCLPVKTKSLTVDGMQHYTPPLQSSTAVTANRVTLPLHMLGVGLRARTTHTRYRQTTTTHVVLFRRWVDMAVRKDHPDTHVEVVRVPGEKAMRHPPSKPCQPGTHD